MCERFVTSLGHVPTDLSAGSVHVAREKKQHKHLALPEKRAHASNLTAINAPCPCTPPDKMFRFHFPGWVAQPGGANYLDYVVTYGCCERRDSGHRPQLAFLQKWKFIHTSRHIRSKARSSSLCVLTITVRFQQLDAAKLLVVICCCCCCCCCCLHIINHPGLSSQYLLLS